MQQIGEIKVASVKKRSNSLKTWFSQNKGKGWVDCKTGKPCGRKTVKNVKVTQLVDQQWHNVKQRQCGRKRLQNEYLGLRRL